MQYYELICKAFIKKDVAFQKSFELLSKYISFSMYQEGESKVHQKEGFKYYVFGGLLPIENEKVYKQGNLYSFTIRSLDETLIDELKNTLRQISTMNICKLSKPIKKPFPSFSSLNSIVQPPLLSLLLLVNIGRCKKAEILFSYKNNSTTTSKKSIKAFLAKPYM